jgi:hypothetical protein
MAKSNWFRRILCLTLVVLSFTLTPSLSHAQNDACKTIKSGRNASCQHPGAGCDAGSGPGTGRCVFQSGDGVCDCIGKPPPADYTLSVSPSSLTISQGNIGSSVITINPLNGFGGSVDLSASGLSAGLTANFNVTSTTNTSTLTLVANSTASLGNATVTITGKSGGLSHSTTISVSVKAIPNLANVVFGPDVMEDTCDMNSPAYVADPSTVNFDACKTISYPQTSIIAQRRFLAVPTGNIEFHFFVYLVDHNSPLHATYTITVFAKNTITGKISSNSGSIRLFGSAATDAPPGVRGTLQANPGSVAFGLLAIPVPLGWAESIVTFQFQLSQGQGSVDPASYPRNCNDPEVCPMWTDYGDYYGPNLSGVSPATWMPAGLTSDAYALYVTPAAQFQLPIVPVAIRYAPLGNGKQVESSYSVSSSAGTNLQFNNSQAQSIGLTSDEKTTYTQGANTGAMGVGYKLSVYWDRNVQSQAQSTYGTSGTFVSSSTFSRKYTGLATTTQPLNQISCSSQPFWQDDFIVTINAQFAAWDYPGSPVVQPLGSIVTTDVPLIQLSNCATTTAPAACTAANQGDPHCVSYDSLGTTQYVLLSSQDCFSIASLDPFFVVGSQSLKGNLQTQPWREIYTGGLNLANNAELQVKSDFPTQGTFGLDHKTQYSTSVTAATSTTLDLSGIIPAGLLNLVLGINFSDTSTMTNSTVLSYDYMSVGTLSTDIAADTTIQDTSGIKANFIILQDNVFQGLAVQDSDMTDSCPPTTSQRIAAMKIPPSIAGMPVVERDDSGAATPTSPYVRKTGYSYVIVAPPAAGKTSVKPNVTRAAKQQIPLSLPTPAAGRSISIDQQQALERLHAYAPGQRLVETAIKQLEHATSSVPTP